VGKKKRNESKLPRWIRGEKGGTKRNIPMEEGKEQGGRVLHILSNPGARKKKVLWKKRKRGEHLLASGERGKKKRERPERNPRRRGREGKRWTAKGIPERAA